jgi:hypothetical protein
MKFILDEYVGATLFQNSNRICKYFFKDIKSISKEIKKIKIKYV